MKSKAILLAGINNKGLQRDLSPTFKHLKKTDHTHDPLDDVIGNAEALLTLQKEYGLNL